MNINSVSASLAMIYISLTISPQVQMLTSAPGDLAMKEELEAQERKQRQHGTVVVRRRSAKEEEEEEEDSTSASGSSSEDSSEEDE